jgi:hypothetical protein
MSTFPKNIYFYWDNDDIPEDVLKNVDNYKKNNLDYNVVILNNNIIDKYKNEFPILMYLFNKVTIAALKADIVRMIILHEEGGMWIDSNTTLIDNNSIGKLFDKYKEFDFVITILSNDNYDLKTSALLSKPKSKIVYEIIQKMTEKLLNHYKLEKKTKEYIPYNFFLFVAPVVCYELLEYKYDNEFRNYVKNKLCNNNLLTLDLPKFSHYNCGLMDISKYLKFYGTNMKHHHGTNFHLHWSNLQKTQKLFIHELNI